MVGDGDEGALPEVGVDAAGGVGDDEGVAAEEAEDASGEGDLGERVALVGVDAALHDGDGDAVDGAEDEFAGVAFDGGEGEVGDFGVGDAEGVSTWEAKLPRPEPRMMPRVGWVAPAARM